MGAEMLRAALVSAALTPRELAHAVNERLTQLGRTDRHLHPTAPYQWLRHDRRPYEPIPRLVAEVLRARTGIRYTAADLWPNHSSPVLLPVGAGDRLEGSLALQDAVWALEDLTQAGDADRARILPVHGPELITAALEPVNAGVPPAVQLRAMLDGEPVLPPMADLIDHHIIALRRLDDRQGGGGLSLRYVIGELRTVLELLNGAGYTPEIGRRLQDAAANLAQLAGWLSFDAGATGAAQRFFFLGLRLTIDRDCSANILGMLAYTTAHTGSPTDALRLGQAAEHAARHLGVGMRARVAGRLATAYAAAGDLYAFRQAAEQARTLLSRRRPEDDPASLYYLSADQLAAETGQALIDLARYHTARSRILLNEAVEFLTPLTSAGLRIDYQRSALLHGCFLTLAHLHRNDLEAACAAATTAIGRLPGVQSNRCRTLLRALRRSFARRKRNVWAADTVQRLDQALLEA